MSDVSSYRGSCFCGAVELVATGAPAAMGYCHCTSCREWSAGPVNAFTLWAPSAVTITKGADNIGAFSKSTNAIRKWCKTCGGHLLTEHPEWDLVDVYAATLPTLPFDAGLHVHYGETVLHIRDGKPKFQDLPTDFKGSGVMLSE
jgi:hypothetical protein